MRFRLVIFDFDGTLADSFPFFLESFGLLAGRHGFACLPAEELEALRGHDAQEMLRKIGLPAWKLPRVARDFRSLMAQHAARIRLFDGMPELLQRLSGRGVKLAVLSSNSRANVEAVLGPAHAGLIDHYACGASLFGKRRKLRTLLAKSGVPPQRALCIGDEIRDIEAAQAEQVAAGAVAWGYTRPEALAARGPQALFSSVEELAAFLEIA
jgi:phosphoglycolate phosphatase